MNRNLLVIGGLVFALVLGLALGGMLERLTQPPVANSVPAPTAPNTPALSPIPIQLAQAPAPPEASSSTDLFSQLTKEQIEQLIVAAGQNAVKRAIQKASPAVVRLEVLRQGRNPFHQFFDDPFWRRFFEPGPERRPQQQLESSLGTGFVIEYEDQKVIVTNNHVVEGAQSIKIVFPNGRSADGTLIGGDAFLDVALVRFSNLAPSDLPIVELADSDKLEIGDWVIAIGNPLGFRHTVTSGIVSALHRDVPKPDGRGTFQDMIQTDAAINPGNSGGPLLDAQGRVIGINTAIALNSEGINFAIPINAAQRIFANLLATGKVQRAWLGVVIQEVDEEIAQQFGVEPDSGVLVADVLADGPSRGILQRGDIILSVAGGRVTKVRELQQQIMYRSVGSTVPLEILRNGERQTVEITLGERPNEQTLGAAPGAPTQPGPQGQIGVEKFGLKVQALTPELSRRLNLPAEIGGGVVIQEVQPGSRAFWAGLQSGDLIFEINRTSVTSLDDWNRIISELADDARVVLTIIPRSGGTARYVPLK
ncbi:trypsin-like peptidase domain-containing protein [Candidatus Acetothermia bacterium]|nr:trypsin-like peptidase domain-containing protein [Candidatus Acetothermia bacterium]MCI2437439.1 trypsin-like peptidase domain-containing protein [Candidatus Acetothermia bacterium]